jgi:Glycosyl hydrolases family 16
MATALSDNSFVRNGQLYIKPTLTSKALSDPQLIFDGGNYTLQGCTTAQTNASACSASSSDTTGATIPPVMSARLTTKDSHSIRFGKVEVVAKLPRGDWLWPAIWMAPVDSVYGPWPLSGEIDVRPARICHPLTLTDVPADYGIAWKWPLIPEPRRKLRPLNPELGSPPECHCALVWLAVAQAL